MNKTKLIPDGEIDKYKAWLVAKGFSQIKEIKFEDKHSHLFPRCLVFVLF